MHESVIRDAVRAYAGNQEPPMSLNSAMVLKAGRRSRATRLVSLVLGPGLASALLVTSALFVSDGLARRSEVATPVDQFGPAVPCTDPPGPRPPGEIVPSQALAPETLEWARRSVTCFLAEALPRLVPDARYAQAAGARGGPLIAYTTSDSEPRFGNRVDTMTRIRLGSVEANLFTMVYPADRALIAAVPKSCESTPDYDCTVRSGPGGAVVRMTVAGPAETRATAPSNIVVDVSRGQTAISFELGRSGAPPEYPILTVEQLVELASAPSCSCSPDSLRADRFSSIGRRPGDSTSESRQHRTAVAATLES